MQMPPLSLSEKRFKGMWLLLQRKKTKEKSEAFMRPGDTGSAIVTDFSFSCSAKCLAQDLTPIKSSVALIHTCGVVHYIVLSFGAASEKQLQFSGNAKCSADPLSQAKGNNKYILLEESQLHNQELVACLFWRTFNDIVYEV